MSFLLLFLYNNFAVCEKLSVFGVITVANPLLLIRFECSLNDFEVAIEGMCHHIY